MDPTWIIPDPHPHQLVSVTCASEIPDLLRLPSPTSVLFSLSLAGAVRNREGERERERYIEAVCEVSLNQLDPKSTNTRLPFPISSVEIERYQLKPPPLR